MAALRKASGKRWRWVGAAVGLLVVVGLAWGYLAVKPYGDVGTTYVAKQLCSCVFLTGRSEASCRGEFSPDIDKMSVAIDRAGLPASGKVRVRLALFANSAVYEQGYGCRIER
jgi:hypothetical protein